MKNLASNKGQALIEFFVTLALTVTLVFGGLQFAYFAWAKLWLRHVLYEAIMCDMKDVSGCESEARQLIRQFLPFGQITEFNLRHPPFSVHGRVRFEINRALWIVEGTTMNHRGKSGGFVFISFLIPLALVIFTAFGLMALIINERSKQLQICRDALLRTNEKIEDGIESILALNEPILTLQLERNALEIAKKADPDPYSLAAIEALIQQNEIEQQFMSLQQKKLRIEALLLAEKEITELRAEASSVGAYKLKNSEPRLVLQAEKTWHTAKTQSRSFQFSRSHRIEASWNVSIEKFKEVFRFPKYFAQKLNIECATNIRREGIAWIPQLAQ